VTRADLAFSPQFLAGGAGNIFVHAVAPRSAGGGDVVVMLPPLFEELNKSRRMYALQARSFASRGLIAILPDLHGIGDSEGDISTASLQIWRQDLDNVMQWIGESEKPQRIHVFGLRSAALFFGMIDSTVSPIASWILWSPIERGSRLVRDLFRQALIVARNRGDASITSKGLRERASAQGYIEISGYRLSADLLGQLENLSVPESVPPAVGVHWFDVRAGLNPGAGVREPASVGRWRDAGCEVDYRLCEGPPFWQTAEISTVAKLVEETTDAIADRN
jgi:exosortase A-associated hydrolase 2